jgi:hypothetical protein
VIARVAESARAPMLSYDVVVGRGARRCRTTPAYPSRPNRRTTTRRTRTTSSRSVAFGGAVAATAIRPGVAHGALGVWASVGARFRVRRRPTPRPRRRWRGALPHGLRTRGAAEGEDRDLPSGDGTTGELWAREACRRGRRRVTSVGTAVGARRNQWRFSASRPPRRVVGRRVRPGRRFGLRRRRRRASARRRRGVVVSGSGSEASDDEDGARGGHFRREVAETFLRCVKHGYAKPTRWWSCRA